MNSVLEFKPALEARDRDRLAKAPKASDHEANYRTKQPWDDSRPADKVYAYMMSGSLAPAFEVQRQIDPKAFRTVYENRLSFGDRVEADDQWTGHRNGYGPIGEILYKLPELEQADPALPVHIPEGEKDNDTLTSLGLISTTNPGGAYAWRYHYRTHFVGRHVIILEDNDDAGRSRTRWIRRTLRKIAASISVIRFEDFGPGADVSDFIAEGHTLADLQARIELLDEPIYYSEDIAEVADKVEAQLIRSPDAGIYQRSDGLYRVMTKPGETGLHALKQNGLLDHISRYCNFYKLDAKGERYPTKPQKELADLIISRVGLWEFPKIAGVLSAPIIRQNGDVVLTNGYDEASQMFLVLPHDEIVVGRTPEEGKAALEVLRKDILSGFPFADKDDLKEKSVDEAVMMAGLLTPVARPSMDVSPMFAVRAPAYGSGKSYYVSCVSMLALGKAMMAISMPTAEDEGEKRLVGAALKGQPIIVLDNANGVIKGDFLSQMIEQPTVTVRPLGGSALPTIVNNFTMYVTGVNTQYNADLVRRVVVSNIDSGEERPETIAYETAPRDLIEQDRAKYLGYALTVMSSYLKHVESGGSRATVGGEKLENFNSFGQWSLMVRESIVFHGMADPVASVKKVRDEDPELAIIRALFSAWPEGGKMTGASLIAKANATEAWGEAADGSGGNLKAVLMEIAGDGHEKINPKTLGHFLRKITGRVVSIDGKNRCLVSSHDTGLNVKTYSLALAKKQPTAKLTLALAA